ncbi:MAG: amino acid ABC transporter ATP-binding protein [Acidocella sp.]|nr:amino acid ABC transporter ATP-binding protein [Acidocella sp.]
MSLITLTDLHKSYGPHEVLKGISLTIEAGEVIALIGKSGSGKSTLLRCINGLEPFQRGGIDITGLPVTTNPAELRALRQRVGMIFQQFNLFPHMTVGRNVMLAPMVVKKQSKAHAEATARQMLDRVGLAGRFDSYPGQMSGGQQQRVAIARALAMEPLALLCDEITSALDPELVNEVLAVMRDLARQGMTLVMVTHEMRFAREVCHRLVFMHQGRIHEVGPPAEIFTAPKTTELRQFIGLEPV